MAKKTKRSRATSPAKKSARKRGRRGASGGVGSRAATVAFVARHMKSKPDISMTELKTLGKSAGHNVYPLIIGLARKELGLSRPGAKRRRPAAGRPSTRSSAAGRKRRGRPPTSASAADVVTTVVNRLRDLERESTSLRRALNRIAEIVNAV